MSLQKWAGLLWPSVTQVTGAKRVSKCDKSCWALTSPVPFVHSHLHTKEALCHWRQLGGGGGHGRLSSNMMVFPGLEQPETGNDYTAHSCMLSCKSIMESENDTGLSPCWCNSRWNPRLAAPRGAEAGRQAAETRLVRTGMGVNGDRLWHTGPDVWDHCGHRPGRSWAEMAPHWTGVNYEAKGFANTVCQDESSGRQSALFLLLLFYLKTYDPGNKETRKWETLKLPLFKV